MAERRMFAKSIVLSDAFLDMPAMSRALYFTLGMLADDEGVVGSPKAAMRQCGATEKDMTILKQKRYVLSFPSGVVIIKHWPINNYIQSDRKKKSTYVEELSTLTHDEKGAYTEKNKDVSKMDTEYQQPVYTGKDSIGKDNINNIVEQIINHLNAVTGARYTTKAKSTSTLIKAHLQEGHTLNDFITVIDKKYAQWGKDPKMSKYLRPETLFAASHFESYLNEIEAKPKTSFGTERNYDYAELEATCLNLQKKNA